MDYEKVYREALERASKVKMRNPVKRIQNEIDSIFPELKDSEDEMIKKALIRNFTNQHSSNFPTADGFTREQILAWLERQGEQKPTDKVEPKFKVGDWITNGDYLWQITNIDRLYYTVKSQDGDAVEDDITYVDNEFHIWTIQDAKDGDILMANAPFIFNGNLEGGIGCPGAHCAINTLGKFQIPNYPEHWTGHTTTPATKEQRDLLFQKMHEAGYKWDAEKKELIEIEKQSEQKPTDKVEPKFKVGNIISNGKIVYRVDGITKNCFGQDCYFLVDVESEKKGLRYLIERDSRGKTSRMGETTWLCEEVDKSFKKQGGQNPIDKVEPKFKVGDWILYSGDYCEGVLHITKIDECGYYIERNGSPHGIISFNHETFMRLWTIQDAKDGDVLANKDGAIFINAGNNGGGTLDCYCYLSVQNKFCTEEHKTGSWFYKNETKPATKEQCDLLFQKMHEAGYEWDAEKKELKKIPNALEECEIEHIEHGKYYYCIKDYYAGGNKIASKGEVVQALRGMRMMGLGVKANEYFIPVKCIVDVRTAWSEEDEEMFEEVCSSVEYTETHRTTCSEKLAKLQLDWLKSLKDRVQTQPKQEWSEEDEQNSAFIVAALDVYNRLREGNNNSAGQEEFDRAVNLIHHRFKSLHPQPKQEWSEEDEKTIDEAVEKLEKYAEYVQGGNSKRYILDLASRVESLRPQPKQEWSEEDEKKRKGLIKGLEDKMGFGWASDPFSREEYIDWLESIKPNHWKPIGEQIKSLRIALQTMPYSKEKENVLVILEELEKL